MPATAAVKKPKPKTNAELCLELLHLERDHADIFARADAIKAELKSKGIKFRETVPGLGYVSVSPPTPEEVTGEAPELAVAAWQALTDGRRAKLLEQGLVKVVPTIKRAFYGRVEAKLQIAGATS